MVHYILLRLYAVHHLIITAFKNRSYPSENGEVQPQYTVILSCSEEEVWQCCILADKVMTFQQQTDSLNSGYSDHHDIRLGL